MADASKLDYINSLRHVIYATVTRMTPRLATRRGLILFGCCVPATFAPSSSYSSPSALPMASWLCLHDPISSHFRFVATA